MYLVSMFDLVSVRPGICLSNALCPVFSPLVVCSRPSPSWQPVALVSGRVGTHAPPLSPAVQAYTGQSVTVKHLFFCNGVYAMWSMLIVVSVLLDQFITNQLSTNLAKRYNNGKQFNTNSHDTFFFIFICI